MNIRDAERQYNNDAEFRALVDHMLSAIKSLQFTPSDLRAAANFASILFESRRIHPIYASDLAGIDPEWLNRIYADRNTPK